jgi:hypothetical protein
MDKSSTPQKNVHVVKMERAEAVETKEVNFLSFNCKNIKTIGPFLHHHHNKIDILLLQEHWLFDHELSLLNEVSQKYCGTGVSGWMVRPPDVPDGQNCLGNLFRFGTFSLGYLFRCQAIWADLLLHL